MSEYQSLEGYDVTSTVKPRITRTRWQLVRWHLKCAWLHALGRPR